MSEVPKRRKQFIMTTNEQQVDRENNSQQQSESNTMKSSPINQMFNGRSVFITGASGFIGRVLLEKLLRTYPGIKTIYILMRPKKDMSPQERLHKHLLRAPIFDNIRQMDKDCGDKQPLLDKIHVIQGDIGYDNLGISSSDLKLLLEDETLSIVYHSAATVKFDEPLKTSIQFNLIATKAVIELCKQLKNLIALCHVSTAYVNSDIKDNRVIEEKIYPMEQTPQQLIKLTQILDENLLQQIKSDLVGERPNTYTYTKALAENLIAEEASELPVAIVRPSIVVAAWKEPIAGWVDNLNGPTGLILAIGKGLLRSMYVTRDVKADIIPVDTCVNTMIAASYYTAKERLALNVAAQREQPSIICNGLKTEDVEKPKQEETPTEDGLTIAATTTTTTTPTPTKSKQDLKIFHCTSGDTNPIRWGEMEDMFFPIIRKYPSQQVLRYPFGSFKSNKYHDLITRLFVHYLPALFIDFLCLLMGKKRQLLSIYYKLHSAVGALTHFCTTNYNFQTKNLNLLEECLVDTRDKRDLQLGIRDLNWLNFWDSYVLGARRYVLKEPDETLESSRLSFKRAYYIELAFRTIVTIILTAMCLVVALRVTPLRDNIYGILTTNVA